jgi:hypothetical protein
MPAVEHSTIGPIGTVIAQTIAGGGRDPAAMFAQVGLDLDSLRDPNVRIPSAKLQDLLELAQERCDDPIFGLHLVEYVHPTTFYSLGIAMYACETLGDYLDCFVKYYRLITTNDFLSASLEDGVYSIRATPQPEMRMIPIRVDGFAALTVRTARIAMTTISFNEPDLAEKLPSANPDLQRLYEKLTVDYLEKIDRADFPGRVHKELIKLLRP